MEWCAAERGELGESLLAAGPARGGGDVSSMVAELVALGRKCKRSGAADDDPELVDAAFCLAESIQACLRPPAAQTLTRAEQRDFRATLAALQHHAARGGETKAASSLAPPPPMEIEGASGGQQQQQQQLRRQLNPFVDDVDAATELALEEDRQQELARINAQVSTVSQIYRDIAGLVNSQQEDVDEIEQLVAASHSRTNKSHAQIQQAVRRKTSKNKCCCYFAVVLCVLAVILVLAIIGFKRVGIYLV